MDARPQQCKVCYEVELVLRPGKSWIGQIPATMKQLCGLLSTMPHWKKLRAQMLAKDCEALIAEKAHGILEEVTRGTRHFGQDSLLHGDVRFKRTRESNLFIGAGNVLRALKEAAQRWEDNNVKPRWLKTRLWTTPGKIVIFRKDENNPGFHIPIKMPDGRITLHIPPERPGPENMFRGKPATIKFAERVDYPAYIRFFLWTTPEVVEDDLALWWQIAEEQGLMGYRQRQQGQFTVTTFRRASAAQIEYLIAREMEKELELH